LILDQKMD